MQFHTYLSFDGTCEAAFTFYAGLFGGKLAALMRFGEMPGDQTPAPFRDRVMHARLELAGHVLMGTDATPDCPHRAVQGSHVVVDLDTPEEAERVFAALAQGGRVEMPIQQTFWAQRYGIVVDRFGVPWMVNCNLPA